MLVGLALLMAGFSFSLLIIGKGLGVILEFVGFEIGSPRVVLNSGALTWLATGSPIVAVPQSTPCEQESWLLDYLNCSIHR